MASVAFGIRYVWKGKIDVNVEPIGIPVYFGTTSTIVLYRAMASVGATF